MIVKAVILVLLFIGCRANPAPDPCETYESKKCHMTTESEGCPGTTEYYDERVDRPLQCCCPCRMGSFTDENPKNTTCFQESIVPGETPTSDYSTTPSQRNYIAPIIVLASGFGISLGVVILFIIFPTIPEKLNQRVCSSRSENGGRRPNEDQQQPMSGVTVNHNGPHSSGEGSENTDNSNPDADVQSPLVVPSEDLSENGRRGQNMQNGVEGVKMRDLGNHAKDQNDARNDGGGNGDIDNQDAEAQRNLLEDANAPQSSA